MKDRIRKVCVVAGMICAMSFSLCGCEKDGKASVEEQRQEEDGAKGGMPSKEEQERVKQAIDQMKKDGILDENGQPMPGVDLNDYPGLG